jgi:hypothetical protein
MTNRMTPAQAQKLAAQRRRRAKEVRATKRLAQMSRQTPSVGQTPEQAERHAAERARLSRIALGLPANPEIQPTTRKAADIMVGDIVVIDHLKGTVIAANVEFGRICLRTDIGGWYVRIPAAPVTVIA